MPLLLRTLTFGVVLTLVVSVVRLSAQERDPRIGTWKLNVAQSTFDPGPPPQSVTRTYEDMGGGVTLFTIEGINAQGNPIFGQVAHRLDGKDYPLATLRVQTVSDHRTDVFTRVDAYTVAFIDKRGGAVVATGTLTVSEDGKTLTYRGQGTDAQGKPFNNVQVFEKQ